MKDDTLERRIAIAKGRWKKRFNLIHKYLCEAVEEELLWKTCWDCDKPLKNNEIIFLLEPTAVSFFCSDCVIAKADKLMMWKKLLGIKTGQDFGEGETS